MQSLQEWLSHNPGKTAVDYEADRAADAALLAQSQAGSPIAAQPTFVSAPAPVTPSPLPIEAVGSIIDSIISYFTNDPKGLGAFQDFLGGIFPSDNTPICNTVINFSNFLPSGSAYVYVPCGDTSAAGRQTRGSITGDAFRHGLAYVLTELQGFVYTSDPTKTGQAGGGVTAPSSVGPVNVTINETQQISDQTLRAVASAVNAGIGAATGQAAAITDQVTSDLAKTLQMSATQLGSFGNELSNFLNNGISGLLAALFNPSSGIVGAIDGALSDLAKSQEDTISAIVTPLSAGVQDLDKALFGLPVSIGQILQGLFGQLPKLLIDVFGGELGPLKDIAHWIEILTGHLPGGANSKITTDGLADILAQIGKAAGDIAGVATTQTNTVYQPRDPLTPSCSLESMNDQLDAQSGKGVELPTIVTQAIAGVGALLTQMTRAIPFLLQFEKLAEESQNKACPLVKLDAATVMQGFIRGLIPLADAQDELLKQGISDSRWKVLRDLAVPLPNAQEALDQWWRSVITDETLAGLLRQNGYTDDQITALKAASFAITPVAEAIQLLNRAVIDDDQFSTILTANRFDSTQINLLRVLAKRPPDPMIWLRGFQTRKALGSFIIPGFTDYDTIDPTFQQLAASAGYDQQWTNALWQSHWSIGDVNTWITAYFRGSRLYSELASIAESLAIPRTILDDLIANARPLIPFRTVPSMITAGLLTDDEGKAILSKHGFAPGDVDKILQYAHRAAKKTAAAAAAATHQASVATARALFDDGAITSDQFKAVLTEHGLTPDAIAMEIQLATITDQRKQRQQAGNDIVNEYLAGLIDEPTAEQNLGNVGFTLAERAKFLRQLKSTKATKVKLPSEPELRAMATKNVITPQDYFDTLQLIGFSATWAQRFRDLHFPAA